MKTNPKRIDLSVCVCHNPSFKEESMAKPKEGNTYARPKCPKCESTQVQSRKTDRKRWCRICLFEGPAKDFIPKLSAA
jgi:hypothetical protein